MKFIFDFLKKLIPSIGMLVGSAVPITLTATALTSSIPADINKSLNIETKDKPIPKESVIKPKAAPEPEKKNNNASFSDTGKSQQLSEKSDSKSPDSSGNSEGSKESKEDGQDPKSNQESESQQPTDQPSPQTNPSPKPKPARPRNNANRIKKLLSKLSSDTRDVQTQVGDVLKKLQESMNLPSS